MVNSDIMTGEVVKTDVLVLGSGAAGCGAAIAAKENGIDVCMIGKSHEVSH